MIKVNDTVRIKNDKTYSYSKLWKVIAVKDDKVACELRISEIEVLRKSFDKSKIQVYIKQNDEWIIGNTLKNKTYQVYFFGGSIEVYEGSSEEEIEEYLEDNWKEITDNLSWNIETEIEER